MDAPAEAQPPEQRTSLRRTTFWLAVTGISLYLVAPSLLDVWGSWRDLGRVEWWWLTVMLVLQALSFACLWELQRLALHGPPWPPVIESQRPATRWRRSPPAAGPSARRCSTGSWSSPACGGARPSPA